MPQKKGQSLPRMSAQWTVRQPPAVGPRTLLGLQFHVFTLENLCQILGWLDITTRQNMSKGYLWRELAKEVSNMGNDRVMEFKRYARERRVIEITRTTIRRRSRRHARATEQSQLGRSSSVPSSIREFSNFSEVGTSDLSMLPTEELERVPEGKWTMSPPQG